MAQKAATPVPTPTPAAAPEAEERKPLRNWSVLAFLTKEQGESLDAACNQLGATRASFVYALLYKATKGFTEFKPDAKMLTIRPAKNGK